MRFPIIIIASLLGIVAALVVTHGVQSGEPGHDPVTLCHWVPAHGGSYIQITVDDDGSDGNGPLQAHMRHDNDIIPAPAGGCKEAPAATVTPTSTGPTATPVALASTPTPRSEIGTPVFVTPSPEGFTPGRTPCVEDEVFDAVTGECIHIDRIAGYNALPNALPTSGASVEQRIGWAFFVFAAVGGLLVLASAFVKRT